MSFQNVTWILLLRFVSWYLTEKKHLGSSYTHNVSKNPSCTKTPFYPVCNRKDGEECDAKRTTPWIAAWDCRVSREQARIGDSTCFSPFSSLNSSFACLSSSFGIKRYETKWLSAQSWCTYRIPLPFFFVTSFFLSRISSWTCMYLTHSSWIVFSNRRSRLLSNFAASTLTGSDLDPARKHHFHTQDCRSEANRSNVTSFCPFWISVPSFPICEEQTAEHLSQVLSSMYRP